MSPSTKTQLVRSLARTLGLDLVGVTRAAPSPRTAYYRDWLAAGYGGTMTYLRRNGRLRPDPTRLLPGGRTVISAALSYKRAEPSLTGEAATKPTSADARAAP